MIGLGNVFAHAIDEMIGSFRLILLVHCSMARIAELARYKRLATLPAPYPQELKLCL